jgi:hypothetical protein
MTHWSSSRASPGPARAGRAYQNEELTLAVEQLRLPSIQCADLFGPALTDHTAKLIETVHQILGPDRSDSEHSAAVPATGRAFTTTPRMAVRDPHARVANPWVQTPRTAPYVLAEDSAAVYQWNESLAPGDPRLIELHVLPEPVTGLHDAPVRGGDRIRIGAPRCGWVSAPHWTASLEVTTL